MEHAHEDLAGMLMSLERLEGERKARLIPAALLESGWALEAQTEAVVDAVLTVAMGGDARAYAHARHVGEWSARIAAQLPCAPAASYMRRCGVLADVEPGILERVREVRDCAGAVRAFQRLEMSRDAGSGIESAAASIIAIADEFDSLVCTADTERRYTPADALRMMSRTADERTKPLIEALRRAMRAAPASLFQTVA